jgi:hypothetical protein
VPELRQHERLLVTQKSLEEAGAASSALPGRDPGYAYEGPDCPCGGPSTWDGHKYRCRGCGLYYETCCDGGRCS